MELIELILFVVWIVRGPGRAVNGPRVCMAYRCGDTLVLVKCIGRVVPALWLVVAALWLQACASAGLGSTNSVSRSSYSPTPVQNPVPHLSAGSLTDSQLGQQMTDYFKGNRLPLVGAQAYTDNSGSRQVVLFGLVATSFGKSDAAQKAASLLNDPAIAIVNRIRIDPTLMAATGASEQPAQNTDGNGATAQTPPPPEMGGVQDYESQNRYSAYQQGQQPPPGMGMFPFMTSGIGVGSRGMNIFGGSGLSIPLTSPYSAPNPGPYPPPGPYNP
jgi:hypothetical protein